MTAAMLPACAKIEPPPGGPPDAAAPQLLETVPDTLAILPKFDHDVEFRFNEVVSEGSQASMGLGTGDLEKLVIVSPTTKVPEVRWRRNRITVRPREGWQPNRVYRVQLLPGLADLRNNRGRTGATVTFSTGAPLPTDTLSGTVVDWTTGRPAAGALVEAVLLPDSLPYRVPADSSGRFRFGPLPRGEYLVYGVLDQNRDLRRDPRDAFDSVRVASSRGNVGELWAFVHDTTPPRIQTVAVADSISATLTFAQPLDPKQRLRPADVRIRRLPDSTAVPVAAVLTKAAADSLSRRAAPRDTAAPGPAPADTAGRRPAAVDTAARGRPAAPADTAARRGPPAPAGPRPPGAPREANAPLTTRPPLSDALVVRAAEPWVPGARYVIDVRGVRNVTGVAGDARGTLVVPAREPADTAAPGRRRQPADSVRPPGRK